MNLTLLNHQTKSHTYLFHIFQFRVLILLVIIFVKYISGLSYFKYLVMNLLKSLLNNLFLVFNSFHSEK